MIQSTRLKRKLGKMAQNGLRQARTGGVYYIVQADQPFLAEHLARLCEYHLPDAFDSLIWAHGSTRVQNMQNESAR